MHLLDLHIFVKKNIMDKTIMEASFFMLPILMLHCLKAIPKSRKQRKNNNLLHWMIQLALLSSISPITTLMTQLQWIMYWTFHKVTLQLTFRGDLHTRSNMVSSSHLCYLETNCKKTSGLKGKAAISFSMLMLSAAKCSERGSKFCISKRNWISKEIFSSSFFILFLSLFSFCCQCSGNNLKEEVGIPFPLSQK